MVQGRERRTRREDARNAVFGALQYIAIKKTKRNRAGVSERRERERDRGGGVG